MTSPRPLVALTGALTLMLAGCGGGGGSSSSSTSAAAAPASGGYAWLLKAQGPTGALQYGLSLLHPSTPGTEYAIEFGSSVVTDAKLVVSGTVDATGLTTGALQPYALLYIIGGDVRRVPMQANGAAPLTQVQRAQSTTACTFAVQANDYAAPENSRYIVTTAGPDGQCGTSDDGRAEVQLDGTGGLTFTPLTAGTPIGLFRDPTTLSPRGWIYPTSAAFWGPGAGTTTTLRTASQAALTAVVSANYRTALVDDGTQLSVIDFPAGLTPTQSMLAPAVTGGGGWTEIGFDSAHFYVYQSNTASLVPSWTILKVSQSAPSATVLASGNGQIALASMGTSQLYVTVAGASGNSLLAISKTPGVPTTTMESTASSTLSSVLTSASGVHELWRTVNIGTAAVNYTIEFIDETGTKLYSTASGGFPIGLAEASSRDFKTSENRTRFIFSSGFGARGWGDATLMGYDAATKSATTFGALPGTSAYGTNFVYAFAQGGPGTFMTGYAAASTGGSIQATGSKVFSFDFLTPASLQYTTAVQ